MQPRAAAPAVLVDASERWTSHTRTKIAQRSRGLPPSARPPPVRLHLALPLRSHTTVAPSRGRKRLTNSPSSWAIGTRVRVAVNPRARERLRAETVQHNSRRRTDTSLRKSEYIFCLPTLPAPVQDSFDGEYRIFADRFVLFCESSSAA